MDIHTATISFCTDLTDPNGVSLPIGVLAIANANGRWDAALAVCMEMAEEVVGSDPLTAYMLKTLPESLKSQIEGILKDTPPAEINVQRLVDQLVDSFRSTIHVSHVSHQTSIVGALDDAQRQLGDAAYDLLKVRFEEAYPKLRGPVFSGGAVDFNCDSATFFWPLIGMPKRSTTPGPTPSRG